MQRGLEHGAFLLAWEGTQSQGDMTCHGGHRLKMVHDE